MKMNKLSLSTQPVQSSNDFDMYDMNKIDSINYRCHKDNIIMKVQREEERFLKVWKDMHKKGGQYHKRAPNEYEVFFQKMDKKMRRKSPNQLV